MPGVAASACTFCGGAVESGAVECSACGNSMVRAPSASAWHAFTPGRHFAALWFLSFGLYSFPWVYRSWRFLREEAGHDVHPHLRTSALLIPGLNLFWSYALVRRVQDFTGGTAREAMTVFITVWATSVLLRSSGSELHLLDLVALAIVAAALWAVQRRINRYYRRTHRIDNARMPLYGWIVCGIGAVLWTTLILERVTAP